MRFALLASLLVACSGSPSAPPTPPATSEPAPPVPIDHTVPVDAAVMSADAAPVDASQVSGPAQSSALGADGAACKVATDCASGTCEGDGCTDDKLGHCAPANRGCTRDRREFCGCDHHIFFGSSSCPGQRYATKGKCPP